MDRCQKGVEKKYRFVDDIPTIGYLQWLHLGILAESMERAAVIASSGQRRANVLMAPFCDDNAQSQNAQVIKDIEARIGLTSSDKAKGWQIRMITQVGCVKGTLDISQELYQRSVQTCLRFAQSAFSQGSTKRTRPLLNITKGRTWMSASLSLRMPAAPHTTRFHRWTGIERKRCKALLLNERVDVLTDGGKERLREIESSSTKSQTSSLPTSRSGQISQWAKH